MDIMNASSSWSGFCGGKVGKRSKCFIVEPIKIDVKTPEALEHVNGDAKKNVHQNFIMKFEKILLWQFGWNSRDCNRLLQTSKIIITLVHPIVQSIPPFTRWLGF